MNLQSSPHSVRLCQLQKQGHLMAFLETGLFLCDSGMVSVKCFSPLQGHAKLPGCTNLITGFFYSENLPQLTLVKY